MGRAWLGLAMVSALAAPIFADGADGPAPPAAGNLDRMLAGIERKDPDALASAAAYARALGLPARADELAREAVGLSPDHASARRLLGQVRVDDRWVAVSEALKLARAKADGGKSRQVLDEILPALLALAVADDRRLEILDLEAHCRLQAGQFDPAGACFAALADQADGARAARYAAVAAILKAHPDGMIVLSEPYPPTASLLSGAAAVKAGPASLSRPTVLEAALHEHAKACVGVGQAQMDEGKKLEQTEPEAAKARYVQAKTSFDAADAIVPELSRSPRVEIARRQIALISRDMNAEAGKFDALRDQLGQRDLALAAYDAHLQRMLRSLNNVRGDLEAILQLADPYERELVLEIADAGQRLRRVNALRDILDQELHGK